MKENQHKSPNFTGIVRHIFSAFLSLLVLVLSCLPCDDATAFASVQPGISAQHTSHEKYGGKDACSPFCACSCCAGVMLPVTLMPVVSPVIPYFFQAFPGYLVSSLPDIFSPVWQPPKLV